MNTYWISFVKEGQGNVGVCIVDAEDEKAAIAKTLDLGINPGGEAALFKMPNDEPEAMAEVNVLGRDRLIPWQELESLGYKKEKDLDEESPGFSEYINNHPDVSRVCEKHNKQD
jgi:hypothetical protein